MTSETLEGGGYSLSFQPYLRPSLSTGTLTTESAGSGDRNFRRGSELNWGCKVTVQRVTARSLIQDKLRWLDVSERLQYKLRALCLENKAPRYLVARCSSVSDVASRQHLRSASRRYLTLARYIRSTFGRREFFVGEFAVLRKR